MEIVPTSRVDVSAPVALPTNSKDSLPNDRQVVGAVQRLNQAEWLGQDRERAYTNDPKTGQFVIQIRERQTGDVVDQIPPESILLLVSELQEELKPNYA
jgi:uncharacterized FlaG/YvyC family protein